MVKAFTRENLGWLSLNRYPEASFKGSDTRLILQFVVGVMQLPGCCSDDISTSGFIAGKSVDAFLRLIFGSVDECGCRNFAFTRNEGCECLALLNLFLEKYMVCAQGCFHRQLCFFNLVPKYHFLLHVAFDLEKALEQCPLDGFVLSPGLFATQMAEDATGRTSRMARHVHISNTSLRVAQRWLIACKLFWDK